MSDAQFFNHSSPRVIDVYRDYLMPLARACSFDDRCGRYLGECIFSNSIDYFLEQNSRFTTHIFDDNEECSTASQIEVERIALEREFEGQYWTVYVQVRRDSPTVITKILHHITGQKPWAVAAELNLPTLDRNPGTIILPANFGFYRTDGGMPESPFYVPREGHIINRTIEIYSGQTFTGSGRTRGLGTALLLEQSVRRTSSIVLSESDFPSPVFKMMPGGDGNDRPSDIVIRNLGMRLNALTGAVIGIDTNGAQYSQIRDITFDFGIIEPIKAKNTRNLWVENCDFGDRCYILPSFSEDCIHGTMSAVRVSLRGFARSLTLSGIDNHLWHSIIEPSVSPISSDFLFFGPNGENICTSLPEDEESTCFEPEDLSQVILNGFATSIYSTKIEGDAKDSVKFVPDSPMKLPKKMSVISIGEQARFARVDSVNFTLESFWEVVSGRPCYALTPGPFWRDVPQPIQHLSFDNILYKTQFEQKNKLRLIKLREDRENVSAQQWSLCVPRAKPAIVTAPTGSGRIHQYGLRLIVGSVGAVLSQRVELDPEQGLHSFVDQPLTGGLWLKAIQGQGTLKIRTLSRNRFPLVHHLESNSNSGSDWTQLSVSGVLPMNTAHCFYELHLTEGEYLVSEPMLVLGYLLPPYTSRPIRSDVPSKIDLKSFSSTPITTIRLSSRAGLSTLEPCLKAGEISAIGIFSRRHTDFSLHMTREGKRIWSLHAVEVEAQLSPPASYTYQSETVYRHIFELAEPLSVEFGDVFELDVAPSSEYFTSVHLPLEA